MLNVIIQQEVHQQKKGKQKHMSIATEVNDPPASYLK